MQSPNSVDMSINRMPLHGALTAISSGSPCILTLCWSSFLCLMSAFLSHILQQEPSVMNLLPPKSYRRWNSGKKNPLHQQDVASDVCKGKNKEKEIKVPLGNSVTWHSGKDASDSRSQGELSHQYGSGRDKPKQTKGQLQVSFTKTYVPLNNIPP